MKKKLIWCCSDLTALGVKDLLSSCGKVLGKDYFLIGHDNIEALSGLEDRAELSTIDNRVYDYGILMAEMILSALEKPEEKVVKFPCKYISRMSFPF